MSQPRVSVIMPVRNEAHFIATSLGAVLAQDYPPELMEILVADGMSNDGTREIIKQIISQSSNNQPHSVSQRIPVILLDNPGLVVPTGFNIALQRASGDVIVRVDGHCEIASDYVRHCVELLETTDADNVGGLQQAVGESLEAKAISLATSSPFGVGGARFHYSTKPGWVDTVYLGAYRREVFNRIGGFDEELIRNQDDEFNFRLRQSGGKIWLDPSIQVLYYSRTGFRKLWKQYFQYGFYKVRVIQKRQGVASWRHLIPAGFLLGLFTTFFLALITLNPLWAFVIAGPYLIANIGASLWTARRDWATLPLLPLAFSILHLAYGIGFLWGLVVFSGPFRIRRT